MPDNHLIIRRGQPTDGELAALLVVFARYAQRRTDIEADFGAHEDQSAQPLGRAPWTRPGRYISPASWIHPAGHSDTRRSSAVSRLRWSR